MTDGEKILNDDIIKATIGLIDGLIKRHQDKIETSFVNFNNRAKVKISLNFNAKEGLFKVSSKIRFPVEQLVDSDNFEIDLNQISLPFPEK